MENQYNFQEFISQGGRFTPLISIGMAGWIGVSAGFTKKFNISSATGAMLYYDQTKNAIGIKFSEKREPGMVSVKLMEKGGAMINAKAFFTKFDIDPKAYKGRFLAKEIETPSGKMYVFEIIKKNST